jgi:uncharacterized protein YndB with AHSA1/START domain
MDHLTLRHVPVARTGMLIRRPAAEVFEAFVDPAITTRFWFTKGSSRLEAGRQVRWDWEMYGFSMPVTAKVIEPNERLVVEWPTDRGPTTVEWTFTPHPDGTFVAITHAGFGGDGDEVVQQVAGSVEGFSLVLAALKAFLEHGIRRQVVADRFPKGLEAR